MIVNIYPRLSLFRMKMPEMSQITQIYTFNTDSTFSPLLAS